jgi:hypothetical protein
MFLSHQNTSFFSLEFSDFLHKLPVKVEKNQYIKDKMFQCDVALDFESLSIFKLYYYWGGKGRWTKVKKFVILVYNEFTSKISTMATKI